MGTSLVLQEEHAMNTINTEKMDGRERHAAFWILVWSVVTTIGAGILFLLLHLHIHVAR